MHRDGDKAADSTYVAASSAPTTVTLAKAAEAALTVTSTAATFPNAVTLTSSGGSYSNAAHAAWYAG